VNRPVGVREAKRGVCSVVLVAAGRGTRFGSRVPKQFVRLGGRMLLEHSLAVFHEMPEVAEVILVVGSGAVAAVEPVVRRYPKVKIARGGRERHDSVRNGMALVDRASRYIAVHDAARPLIDAETVRRVLRAVRTCDAAVPGLPVTDTVKMVSPRGFVISTPDRTALRAVQTPQVFRRRVADRVYAPAVVRRWTRRRTITDDVQLAELEGFRVRVVAGSVDNIKVTTPDDLETARRLLTARAPEGR
jgi:2-C-methyl-D-erythritol 4-phosphate cytidylyltransferase